MYSISILWVRRIRLVGSGFRNTESKSLISLIDIISIEAVVNNHNKSDDYSVR